MRHHVHFIGIGGIGASSLARAYCHLGWHVTGSDTADSALLNELKKEGVSISIGHAAGAIKKQTSLVVYSLAVKTDDPELRAARKLGVPAKSYPEALAEFSHRFFTIGVSGSHGKSTTTSMLGLMLIKAGLDPTVIVGTKLREFGNSNFRPGKSKFLVIEADEWAKSFLNYDPQIAVITNIDKEHLDTYGSLAGVKKTFRQYAAKLAPESYLVINSRDKNSAHLPKATGATVMRFSKPKKPWPLKIAGDHNQLNAEAAWQAASILGVKKSIAAAAVSDFRGAWRRMERLEVKGMTVFSDYAHHPTEIAASISGFKQAFPGRKLLVVYQPHQIERLTRLFKEFTHAFSKTDELWLVPTYQVKGREYRGKKKTSEDLSRVIKKSRYFGSVEFALKELKKLDAKKYCFVVMGAGDIDAIARERLK